MLRIAVCDDEKSMGDYLKRLIEQRLADEKDYGVEVFSSGAELLRHGSDFDIFFLDIDLKDMSGIEMARSLRRESEAVIVFVTALKEYAAEAFEVSAFSYLLKPVEQGALFALLDGLNLREQENPGALTLKTSTTIVRWGKAISVSQ